ncbi:MAG: histidine phosphatase family protein [Oleiphilaceae bacterium]|nr:histidine phosphatase family protein [Oleiphilaceae bacterium]
MNRALGFRLLILIVLLSTSKMTLATEAAWQALAIGEAVLILRHALAPGTGDPTEFDINDCATQRNLSDQGRQEARAWKAYLAARGIDTARVFTSQWCRAKDTATAMDIGPVEVMPSLNSFFENRADGPDQTRATINKVNSLPDAPPVVLVSHQVNVTALSDIYPASNEGVILSLPLSDDPSVLARVSPE